MQITPLHLAASFSFLGVLWTEFDSALTGISIEKDDLDNLYQETAAKEDDNYRQICARGA